MLYQFNNDKQQLCQNPQIDKIIFRKPKNTSFKEILDQESININHHSYYLKWLRYYYDFCHKYKHPVEEQSSLPHFTNKLQEKNQKEFQIRQAEDAINLYYKIILRSKPVDNKAFLDKDSLYTQVKNIQPQKDDLSVTYKVDQESKVHEIKNHKDQEHTSGMTSDNKDYKVAEFTPRSVPKSSIQVQPASWVSAYNALKTEIKVRHYSPKTLKSYKAWMHKFQTYTKSKPLELLTDTDIKEFLSYLAVEKNVSASTQNQAFNALLFFYRHILKREPGEIKDTIRAKRKQYIPVVLTREEINMILKNLTWPFDLVIKLLYGCGLRLFECLGLRVQDFNFDTGILTIHDGK